MRNHTGHPTSCCVLEDVKTPSAVSAMEQHWHYLVNKASMRDDQRCLHSSADDTLISSCLIVTYCGCCMPDLLSLYSYYLFGWLIAHIFWLLHLFVYDNLICSQLNQLTFLQCNWIGKNVSYIFLCYSLESHNCMIYVCVYFVSLIQETDTKR